MHLSFARLAFVLCSGLVLLAACREERGRKATDGGLRDAGASGGPGSELAACYAAARTTDAGLSQSAKCVCNQCLAEITACNDDRACSEIRACMLRTACTITSCYTGEGLCRAVIEEWSPMSLSYALAQRIDECSNAMACNDPGPQACSSVATFECDGAEDCGAGRACCARFDGASYDRSSCSDSCKVLSIRDGSNGVQWSELCHPGDECSEAGHRCLGSEFLPSFLYRCRDIGAEPAPGPRGRVERVICGEAHCGKDQKCCVRAPKAPYCAAVEDECACSKNLDAGPDANDDAGSDDAG